MWKNTFHKLRNQKSIAITRRRIHYSRLAVETLESRLVLDSKMLAGLEFVAENDFDTDANDRVFVSGNVVLKVDGNSTSLLKFSNGVSFQENDNPDGLFTPVGTVSLEGASTAKLLNGSPHSPFRAVDLLGDGFSVDAADTNGVAPIDVAGVNFSMNTLKIGGVPDDPVIQMQGDVALPQLGASFSFALPDNPQVYVEAADTGVQLATDGGPTEFSVAIENTNSISIGNLTITPLELGIRYEQTEDTYTITGGASFQISPLMSAPTTITLGRDPGSTGLVITNGALTNLDLFVDNKDEREEPISFQFDTLQITPKDLHFTYEVGDTNETFTFSGGIGVALKAGGETQSVSLELEEKDGVAGIVVEDGQLTNLRAKVTADFNFKKLKIGVQDVTLAYDRAADSFEFAGSIMVSTTDDAINVSATFGDGDKPGLVIKDGQVTDVHIVVNSGFSLKGLTVEATDVTIIYAAAADQLQLSGGVNVALTDRLTVQAAISADTPLIIDTNTGHLAVGGDGLMISGGLQLGPFNTMAMLNYTQHPPCPPPDPETECGLSLDAGVMVHLPQGIDLMGSFDIKDGRLKKIMIGYDNDVGKPIGATGFFLTGMSGSLNNLDSPDLSDLVVMGTLDIRFGTKINFAGGDYDLLTAHGSFTLDRDHLNIMARAELVGGKLGAAAGMIDLNWATGVFKVEARLGLVCIGENPLRDEHHDSFFDNCVIDAEGTLYLDKFGNITLTATANVQVPLDIPFIGGATLDGVNLLLNIRPRTPSQNFVAVWKRILFWDVGVQYNFETGKFNFIDEAPEPIEDVQRVKDGAGHPGYFFHLEEGFGLGVTHISVAIEDAQFTEDPLLDPKKRQNGTDLGAIVFDANGNEVKIFTFTENKDNCLRTDPDFKMYTPEQVVDDPRLANSWHCRNSPLPVEGVNPNQRVVFIEKAKIPGYVDGAGFTIRMGLQPRRPLDFASDGERPMFSAGKVYEAPTISVGGVILKPNGDVEFGVAAVSFAGDAEVSLYYKTTLANGAEGDRGFIHSRTVSSLLSEPGEAGDPVFFYTWRGLPDLVDASQLPYDPNQQPTVQIYASINDGIQRTVPSDLSTEILRPPNPAPIVEAHDDFLAPTEQGLGLGSPSALLEGAVEITQALPLMVNLEASLDHGAYFASFDDNDPLLTSAEPTTFNAVDVTIAEARDILDRMILVKPEDETVPSLLTITVSGITGTGALFPTTVSISTSPSIIAIDANEQEGKTGTTSVDFHVIRSPANAALTVDYAVMGSGANPADAADFAGNQLPTGSVTFATDEISKTITIPVTGDSAVESDESFTVTLTRPPGTVLATALGVIINDDVALPPLMPDAIEPNNNRGESIVVDKDMAIGDLSIHNGDDVDFFRITLPAGTTGTSSDFVEAKFSHTEGDLDLELLDSAGDVIAFSKSETDDERISLDGLASGDYFVRVFGFSSATADYTIMFELPERTGDRLESNNNRRQATEVTEDVYTDLSIHGAADEDFFKINLPISATNADFVEILFSHSEGDLDLELQDGAGNPVEISETTTNAERISLAERAAGEYFVRVYGYHSATADYTITFDLPETDGLTADRLEPNNNRNDAREVGQNQTLGDLSIYDANDEDFFRISVPEGVTGPFVDLVQIQFSHQQGDLDLQLQDATGGDVATSAGLTDEETISLDRLASGDYFVRVYGYRSATAGYDITFNLPGSIPFALPRSSDQTADRLEPNNSSDEATEVGQDQVLSDLTIHDANDEDFFKILVPEGVTGTVANFVQIQFSHEEGDLDLELLDAAGDFIAYSETVTDDEWISLDGLTSGDYFVRVYGFDAATAEYAIMFDLPDVGGLTADRLESNNSSGEATEVAVDAYNGLSIHDADEDYFRINLPIGGTRVNFIGIQFSHSEGDLDLQLLDTDGNIVLTSDTVTNEEEISLEGLLAGDYFVRVYGFDSATAAYAITFDSTNFGDLTVDRLESNNNIEQAGQLDKDQTIENLSIHEALDEDYFMINLPVVGTNDNFVEIMFSHQQGDLDLELLDAVGNLVDYSESVTDDERTSLEGLTSGDYFVRVFGFNGATANYTIRFDSTEAGDVTADPLEPNNDVGQASQLSKDQAIHELSIHDGIDVDIFKITIPAGTIGTSSDFVEARFSHGEGDLDMELLDDAGNLVDFSETETDDERISLEGLPGGDYFVRVYGFDSATASYSIAFAVTSGDDLTADPLESNNSLGEATEVTEHAFTNLSIHDDVDEDFFKINVPISGTSANFVEILFSNGQGDLDLELLNDSGDLVAFSETVTDDEWLSLDGLPAGDYFVHVYGYSSATAGYDIRFDLPNADGPSADHLESNDNSGQATEVTEHTYSSLSIHGAADEDFFKFNLPASGTSANFVEILFSDGQGDLDLELLDAAGEVLAFSETVTDDEWITLEGLPSGEYFVRVYGYGSATAGYDITFDLPQSGLMADRFESINGSGEPTEVTEDVYRSLSIHEATDEDLFKFNLAASAGTSDNYVELLFSHSEGDLDLELQDAAGNAIATSISETDDERITLEGLAAGDYLVRVYGYNSATADYAIMFGLPEGEANMSEPPTANADVFTMVGGTIKEVFDVYLNDTDDDSDLANGTAAVTSQPANGLATTSGPSIQYTPSVGFIGVDSFNYVISDDTLSQSDIATVTVYVADPAAPWQNPGNPSDVIPDNIISPLDALLVINVMGTTDLSQLPTVPGLETAPPPFLDVNGNNVIDPMDALLVINDLPLSTNARLSGSVQLPPPAANVTAEPVVVRSVEVSGALNADALRRETALEHVAAGDDDFSVWPGASRLATVRPPSFAAYPSASSAAANSVEDVLDELALDVLSCHGATVTNRDQ